MPFSHHSHSGQFCAHAKNSLENVVQTAIEKGMQMYALTEHMPRHFEDFYPEEINDFPDAAALARVSDDFYAEAHRLRAKFDGKIHLPIGFESEWIRPESLELIKAFQEKFKWDFFLGSVHHVHTIPIDFDRHMYEEARRAAGGSDERLFEDYFDSQFEMLQALRPPVVGHFDLIRLLSDEPDDSLQQRPSIWKRILRNLDFVAQYGGLLEINTAALRKGLAEPYPKVEICQEFLHRGGGFVLSDDSHGIEQVATNYGRVLSFIEAAGIERLHSCLPTASNDFVADTRFEFKPVELCTIKELAFWTSTRA